MYEYRIRHESCVPAVLLARIIIYKVYLLQFVLSLSIWIVCEKDEAYSIYGIYVLPNSDPSVGISTVNGWNVIVEATSSLRL